MRYIHSQHVIHRDLKPSNIFLDARHEVRIGDFGSGTLSTLDATQTRERGTLCYMAPEQRSDDYTNKVDVYSFGLIFYEILTGVKVFPSSLGVFATCEAARSGRRPAIPGWITNWVHDLIEACWSVDPDVRPSFADIADELKRHQFIVHHMADVRIDDISEYVCRIESELEVASGL
jgi:serine/threonine protein kinase